MTRKAIDELGAAAARDRIARTIGVERQSIGFFWSNDRVEDVVVEIEPGKLRALTFAEHDALSAVGVLPGADGWDIEEPEPAKAERRPLPAGWVWRRDGMRQWLARGDEKAPTAEAWESGRWRVFNRVETVYAVAEDQAVGVEAAQEAAERECWARGLFGEEKPEPRPREIKIEVIREDIEHHPYAKAWIGGDRGPASDPARALRKAIATMTDPDDVRAVSDRQDAAIDEACEAFVAELRAELAPETEPDSNDGSAGMVPRDEFEAMAERAMRYQRKEEGVRFSLATMLGCAGMWSEIEKKIESLKTKPEPSPRTTDGALTAYLVEHYPDEWRPGEDALALAIRLLGETQRIIDEAHLEAERSVGAAKEMAAELNAANSRAAEAEHDRDVARDAVELRRVERDEARTDLAVLRGLCRGFAAKIGAPHG